MHKDSTGHVGFVFKNGKITSIVKDSSAARNGLLTEHNICEINGQNVIGLKVRAELTSYCLVLEASFSFVFRGGAVIDQNGDILWGAGCALMLTSRIVASVWVRSLKSLELEFCEDLGSEDVDEILNEWLLFCPIAFFSPGVVGNE